MDEQSALPLRLDGLTPLTVELARPASFTGARAFADDPTTRYVIPDESRRANLHYAVEYYLRLAAASGGGFVTSPQCEGLAVWLDPAHKESFISHLRAGWPLLPLRCGLTYLRRESELDRHYGKLRRELAPKRHAYLALLAVDPVYHGQGFASRLMRPMLKHLDDNHLPAYLETQTPRNVEMYRRWGFQLLREEPMPGAHFKLYLMLRPPLTVPDS